MTDIQEKRFDGMASVLRYHAQPGRVFDHSNDTVIVTRTMLINAAEEIDELNEQIKELRITAR